MATKTADGTKVTSVAAALRQQATRRAKRGPTVRVRVLEKCYYGFPLPQEQYPGDVISMRVVDLQPWTEGKEIVNGARAGKTYHSIEHEGVKYQLPTWAIDASAPLENDEPEYDDDDDDEILNPNPSRRRPAPREPQGSGSGSGGVI